MQLNQGQYDIVCIDCVGVFPQWLEDFYLLSKMYLQFQGKIRFKQCLKCLN